MMKPQSWKLAGGLNLVRDAITRHRAPGELIGCMNYESREEGYRRIDGYERFDGRKAPSDILEDEPGTETAEGEKRRKLIGQVPGDTLLATWRFRDRTYAWSLADDVVTMYGSSENGWVAISLAHQMQFDQGRGTTGALEPVAGDTLRSTSATQVRATVVAVHTTSGSWANQNAAGLMVLRYAGDDEFEMNNLLLVNSSINRRLTVKTVPTPQGFGDGPYTFRFLNHNFFGLAAQERMYGVSGNGKLFEYDGGSAFFELETGVTTSSPTHLAAHQNHLFVGYSEGAVSYSGTGKPRSFAADDGAGEFTLGDTLTALLPGYRNVLFVYGRNRTAFLAGSSNQDFKLHTVSDEAGAMEHTAVLMDQPTVLDDRGLRNAAATEQFGDFSISTISEPIRPLLDFKRDGETLPVASTRIRRKSQFRIFFADGDCLVANYVRRRGRLVAEFTRSSYDVFEHDVEFDDDGKVVGSGLPDQGVISSICSVEDSNGRERVFCVFRGHNYVFELDRGKSFDGHPIPHYLRTPYNDFRAPHLIKHFRKLLLEVDSTFESTFRLAADFQDDRVTGEEGRVHTVVGPASFWDEAAWDASYWDTIPLRTAEQRIPGRGRNISITVASRPERVEEAHIITGVTVLYHLRRMKR